MFSNTLTKLSLIPPCLFPDGKTLLEKWMYLMPCRHFQGNCRESHHPSLLPASHRTGSSLPAPDVSRAVMPWGSLGHGCGFDVGLGDRIWPCRGLSWHRDMAGVLCVSCFPPVVLQPGRPHGLSPSLCHLEHLRKWLWTSPYESYLDPVSTRGNHDVEISLCFRSYGWAPREQEPAQAVCSGLHQPRLGHRRRHFILVRILDYQLVQLFIAIYENWWCFFLFR